MLVMLLILLGMFVVFPVALFFGLRWVAFRYLPKDRAGRKLAITATGYALYGCLLLVLLLLTAAPRLQPDGPLATFLRQPGDLVAGILLSLVGCTIAERILVKLERPTTRGNIQP